MCPVCKKWYPAKSLRRVYLDYTDPSSACKVKARCEDADPSSVFLVAPPCGHVMSNVCCMGGQLKFNRFELDENSPGDGGQG